MRDSCLRNGAGLTRSVTAFVAYLRARRTGARRLGRGCTMSDGSAGALAINTGCGRSSSYTRDAVHEPHLASHSELHPLARSYEL